MTEEEAEEIKVDYQATGFVQRIFPNAKPHPSPLVTPMVMLHDPGDITYKPDLPPEITDTGKLSSAQLEAIILNGQTNEEKPSFCQKLGFCFLNQIILTGF